MDDALQELSGPDSDKPRLTKGAVTMTATQNVSDEGTEPGSTAAVSGLSTF